MTSLSRVGVAMVLSAKEAKALGLKRYSNGKPCPQGHVGERFTTNRACCECLSKSSATWDQNNRDRHSARNSRYRKKNIIKHRASGASYRASIRAQATPNWAERDAILVYYWFADVLTNRTKVKHQVDHYYPIRGKDSCGLHIPRNLQVLPSLMNRRKGNKIAKQNHCHSKTDEHTVALLERGKINGRLQTE